MDPLSISTAVLACIGAATALANTVSKLRRLKNSPQEIADLTEDISAVQAHATRIDGILQGSRSSREALSDVSSLGQLGDSIEKARKKTIQVREFLEHKLLKDGSAAGKLKKSAWLQWQKEFLRLRGELRDIRAELDGCMILFSAAGVRQNELQLEEISVDNRQMHTESHAFLRTIQEELARQRPALAAELAIQMANMRGALQSSFDNFAASSRRHSLGDLDSVAPDEQQTPGVLERRYSESAAPAKSDDCHGQHEDGVVFWGRRHSEAIVPLQMNGSAHSQDHRGRSLSASHTTDYEDPLVDASRPQLRRSASDVGIMRTGHLSDQPTVALQLSQRLPGRCKTLCPCQCHHAHKFKTPDALRSVTGQVLLDFSGMGFSVPCNEHACAKRQKATMRVQYHFPVWSYIQGVLTLVSRTTGARGPENSLRLSRLRPGLHEVFIQVQSGDNGRLMQMFENGEASPYDATDTGWTLLHYALSAGQLHTVQFLKDAGADLNAESLRRETPFDIAWNRILSGSVDSGTELILRSVFNNTEQLDARRFTMLHKIVLGLVGRSLEQELKDSTANINTKDSTGYTPLAWAAARGDTESVAMLLFYGASVNTTNKFQYQPIHLAAQSGNIETIRHLIREGASINTPTADTKMTPLHEAVQSQDNGPHVQGLCDLGARIDGQDFCAWTPLHWACWRGYLQDLKTLLANHANVHARTNDGNAAVMLAVANNSANCIPTLLSAGAECRVIKHNGWSVMHYAAVGGKLETLQALAKGDLSGCNLYSQRTSDTKQTVNDLLSIRFMALEHKPQELKEIQGAWDDIIERVNLSNAASRRTSVASIASTTDGREFVDAYSDLNECAIEDDEE